MLLIVELTAKDDESAADVAQILDSYFESLLGARLLRFRIARHTEHPARLVVLEEWTDSAAHDASMGSAVFQAMRGEMAPLLAAAPNANIYEIIAAGVASE